MCGGDEWELVPIEAAEISSGREVVVRGSPVNGQRSASPHLSDRSMSFARSLDDEAPRSASPLGTLVNYGKPGFDRNRRPGLMEPIDLRSSARAGRRSRWHSQP